MAVQSRTLSDTKGFARVLVTLQNDSSTSTVVDASGLNAHQNGGQLKIRHIEFALSGSTTINFVKNIKNTAGAATHATDGDIESAASSCTGYIVLDLVKDNFNYS